MDIFEYGNYEYKALVRMRNNTTRELIDLKNSLGHSNDINDKEVIDRIADLKRTTQILDCGIHNLITLLNNTH